MTRFEIFRGLKELNAARQLADLENFCHHVKIFPVTEEVFNRASVLWVVARRGGYPRYDADLIIAATALEQGRILVTGNTAHFSWIPGLAIADWRQP